MAEALFSAAWLAACNESLASLGHVDARATHGPLVVTEIVTASGGAERCRLTLVVDDGGVRLVEGDDERACAWITLSDADAEAMHAGSLDPAAALGQGRVRVRGDLRALVDAIELLAAAHDRLVTR